LELDETSDSEDEDDDNESYGGEDDTEISVDLARPSRGQAAAARVLSALRGAGERVRHVRLLDYVQHAAAVAWWRARVAACDVVALLIRADFATFEWSGQFWRRHTALFANKLWERGPDSRVRRIIGGWRQLSGLLLLLLLLWLSACMLMVPAEQARAAVWAPRDPATPQPTPWSWSLPSFGGSGGGGVPASDNANTALSADAAAKLDLLMAERAQLDARMQRIADGASESVSKRYESKLAALEAELNALRAANAKLEATKHTHERTPDGRYVMEPADVHSLLSDERVRRADIEALLDAKLSSSALVDAARPTLSSLVDSAVADAKFAAANSAGGGEAPAVDTKTLQRMARDAAAAALDEKWKASDIDAQRAKADAERAKADAERARAQAAAEEASAQAKLEAAKLRAAGTGWGGGGDAAVRRVVEQYLDADRVARPDYALNLAGATVLTSLTSPAYYRPITQRSVLDLLALRSDVAMPPEVALSPDNQPGNCYALSKPTGTLAVRLAAPLLVSHVTIDHISPAIAYNIGSAPRRIQLWGYADANGSGERVDLGIVEYIYDAEQTFNTAQTFEAAHDAPIAAVAFEVLSNYGNEQFTCLYRVRVHGTPAEQ